MAWRILIGDVLAQLATLKDESVHCCITSPPYWGLRDYSADGQLGLEATPEEHVAKMVQVFREVRRVLRKDGTCWVNYGDCYAGAIGSSNFGEGAGPNVIRRPGYKQQNKEQERIKVKNPLPPKNLVGMPWRVAFALQADGWWLRSDIVWHKPNPMPESVTDRPTKSHEYVFLLTKAARYFYDAEAVREKQGEQTRRQKSFRGGCYTENKQRDNSYDYSGHDPYSDGEPGTGRNLRTVWTIPTQGFPQAHFATFPTKLVEPCVKAGCPIDGVVLDPFCGSGTTGVVALRLQRNFIGIELNPEYAAMAERRIIDDAPLFNAPSMQMQS